MSTARHRAVLRPWWRRWLPAPGAAAWPAPGQDRAVWVGPEAALAWASAAGPHHLNQDCVGAAPWPSSHGHGHGLALALADGVTQGAAGDVAALALVRHWLAGPADTHALEAHLAAAETAVQQALAALTPEPGAATGAAAWLGPDGQGWITRVGDCRLLRLSPPAHPTLPWGWQPLLPDQCQPGSGQPSHMVGCGQLGRPEWLHLALAPGELLLLCSDGLHAHLPPLVAQRLLRDHLGAQVPQGRAARQALPALLDDLIQMARQAGSEDDISALIAAMASPLNKEPTGGGCP